MDYDGPHLELVPFGAGGSGHGRDQRDLHAGQPGCSTASTGRALPEDVSMEEIDRQTHVPPGTWRRNKTIHDMNICVFSTSLPDSLPNQFILHRS